MNISDKIDSLDALRQCLSEAEYNDYRRTVGDLRGILADNVAWWAVREYVRFAKKVYQTSEVLDRLNKYSQTYVHLSSEAPDMVAYTPDKASGEADRQIRSSLGKFISKFFPLYADHYVRDLVAEHLAEVRCEVDFYTGEDIVTFYHKILPAFSGVGSCMTGKESFKVQPAVAYAVPDGRIKLAVIYKDEAKMEVAARTLVYEHGDDKRWIRCYGDTRLVKRLERLGFVKGGWEGVEFNAVRLHDKESGESGVVCVAMPYLDCYGSTAQAKGSSIAYIDGKLRGLTRDEVDVFARVGSSLGTNIYSSGGTTAGYVTLREIKIAETEYTCFVDGQRYSKLFKPPGYVFYNGEVRPFNSSDNSLPPQPNGDRWANATLLREGMDPLSVYFSTEQYKTFVNTKRGIRVVDTPEARKQSGYFLLDESLYGAEQWELPANVATVTLSSGKTALVRKEHSIWYLRADGTETRIHMNDIQKGDIALHKHDGQMGYVQKGGKVYRTVSGRKVHPAFNKTVLETCDGYDFTRNLSNTFVFPNSESTFGYTVKHLDNNPKFDDFVAKFIDEELVAIAKNYGGEPDDLINLVKIIWQASPPRAYPGDEHKHLRSSVAYYEADELVNTAYKLEDYCAILLRSAFPNSNSSGILHRIIQRVRTINAIKIAEACAVEAPQVLTPAVEAAPAEPIALAA